jgi:penicillin-binding protein 1A
VYTAALEQGMTPSSIVNDAPVSVGGWHPQNASNRYYGPTPLRNALMYSRNVVAVKLLQKVGIDKAIKLARDFGFEKDELPRVLPLALGSGSASPLRMAQMYAVFANGGFRVDPYFIASVESYNGRLIYQANPPNACVECEDTGQTTEGTAKRIMSPKVHFMMNSMLQDVVRKGTARKALSLGRSDIAGKTGTTNDFHDAWFNGYTPDLVTITWFGFDTYKSLGRGQMGGELALPMWIKFMKVALENVPEYSFPLPIGVSIKPVKIQNTKDTTASEYEFLPEKGSKSIDDSELVKHRKRRDTPNDDGGARDSGQNRPTSGGRSVESLF